MGAGCCKSEQVVGLEQNDTGYGSSKPIEYDNGCQMNTQQYDDIDHFLKGVNVKAQNHRQEEEEEEEPRNNADFSDIQKYSQFLSEGCEILDKPPQVKNSMIHLMESKYGKFKFYKKQFEQNDAILCPAIQIPDGTIFIGQWLNKEFHGRGKLITEEECVYEGYFFKGKKQGYGRMLFSSGDYYQGEWYDDQMEGQGILILRDGSQFQGLFYQSIYIGNQKGMKFEDNLNKGTQESGITTTKRIISENVSQYESSQKMNNNINSNNNLESNTKKQQSQFKKFQEQQVNNSPQQSNQNNSNQPSQDKQQQEQLNTQSQIKQKSAFEGQNSQQNKEIAQKSPDSLQVANGQQANMKSGSVFGDFSIEKKGASQQEQSNQNSKLQQENYEDYKNVKLEQLKNLSLQKNSQQGQDSVASDNKIGTYQISQMNFTRREEVNGSQDKYSLDVNNDDIEDEQNNSRDSSLVSLKYERRATKCGDRLVNLHADLDKGLEISNIEFNEILAKYLEGIQIGGKNNTNNENGYEEQMNQSMVMISFQQLMPQNMKQKMAYFQELLQINNFHHDDVKGRVVDQMDFQTFRIYQQKQIYKIMQNKEDPSDLLYKKRVQQQNEILESQLMKKIISRGDQQDTYKHIALLGLKQIYEKQGVLVKLIQQKEEKSLNDQDKNFNAVKQHLIQSGFVMQNYYSVTLCSTSEWKYELAVNDKRKFSDYVKRIILYQNRELSNKDILILGVIRGENGQIKIDFYIKNEVIPIQISTLIHGEIVDCKQFPIIDEITLNIDSFFDNQWNMVWDSNTIMQYRGNINGTKQQYFRPKGYFGSALKVINKYPNDGWINNDTSDKTWIVLFHGSKKQSTQELLEEGYKQCGLQQYQGHQCRFGRGIIKQGIYFYEQIHEAEKFANTFFINEKQYYLLFQCRINPKYIKSPINKPSCYIASDPKDVRPYRIIIKEINVKLLLFFIMIYHLTDFYKEQLGRTFNELKNLNSNPLELQEYTCYLLAQKLISVITHNFEYLENYKQLY